MIGIIDYGMGNIFSLMGALDRLQVKYQLVAEPQEIKDCSGLILPGVGAFGDAMANLRKGKLDQAIVEWALQGKPLLGICLGMQLLFEASEEHGLHDGLGLLPGTVRKIPPGLKVPHMGWNSLTIKEDQPLFQGLPGGYVYFVHSYYAQTSPEYILASTSYIRELPAVVGQKNIVGMQFHPEKSGQIGLKLLANYLKMVDKEEEE